MNNSLNRRKNRSRNKLLNNTNRPRLSVFRSSKHIYASIISSDNLKTVCSISSLSLKKEKDQTKSDIAKLVGEKIAELAKNNGIEKVKFDKGPYKYHGRVKYVADAAREKGLSF